MTSVRGCSITRSFASEARTTQPGRPPGGRKMPTPSSESKQRPLRFPGTSCLLLTFWSVVVRNFSH